MRVDSVAWVSRHPDRYYAFPVIPHSIFSNNCESPSRDSVCELYEFYFDNPHTVIDTYYVGIRFYDVSVPDEPYFHRVTNTIVIPSYPCDFNEEMEYTKWIYF